MALFENYERRVDKINSVLAQYGISSIEELPPLPNVATGEGIEELQAAIDAASEKEEQLKITEVE